MSAGSSEVGQINSKLRRSTTGVSWWCPGCREMHHVPEANRQPEGGWTSNQNYDALTLTPSVKVTGKRIVTDADGRWTGEWERDPKSGEPLDQVCHLYVTNGRLIFLSDCTHDLRGQTVDIPDLPPHHRDPLNSD